MKTLTSLLFLCLLVFQTQAQTSDNQLVERACLDYLEGFYEGDTTKLIQSLNPTLHKFGFWKNKDTGKYELDSYMSFDQAKAYANNVREKQRFPKANAPKKVEVLDVMNQIASAKVTAWWGTDYLLLARRNGKWMIEQVIWEGPLEK